MYENRVNIRVKAKQWDNVYVTEYHNCIKLRIGEPRPGVTRFAYLDHEAARRLACYLETASDNVEDRINL